MTWLSLICSSLVAAASLGAATVSGTVVLKGAKGKVRPAAPGVVIWLVPADGREVELKARKATMTQKDKTFSPHVLAIPAGSSVEFPNYDPIFHNAFSNYSGQVFDVGLYPPGTRRTVTFRREGIVRVFCNIHPTMTAVIAVLRTNWFDVTQRNGAFSIAGVPEGDYVLEIFHERATADTLDKLRQKLTVEGDLRLGSITVSETGFLSRPHKNKYGKDYPAVIEDHPTYPGVRR